MPAIQNGSICWGNRMNNYLDYDSVGSPPDSVFISSNFYYGFESNLRKSECDGVEQMQIESPAPPNAPGDTGFDAFSRKRPNPATNIFECKRLKNDHVSAPPTDHDYINLTRPHFGPGYCMQ